MKISSPGKDKLMERNFSLEKRSEETTRSTGKTGLPPWYQQYRFQEEPTDNQRPLHGDPRDKHDNDFIPSDDDSDHGYGHPGVGIGPTTDLPAYDSFASDQGTWAGTNYGASDKEIKKWFNKLLPKNRDEYNAYRDVFIESIRQGMKHSRAAENASSMHKKGAKVAELLDRKFSTTSTQHGKRS
jgi:hypothetical protein